MGTVLALLATLAALALAMWPVVRRNKQGPADAGNAELNELLSQRDVALNDIRDLDFDRDLGNLSEEDHQQLREQSKRHAVAILKKLNAEEHRIDADIEQAVAALRQGPSSEP